MHLHAAGISTGASMAAGAKARHTQNEQLQQQQNNITAEFHGDAQEPGRHTRGRELHECKMKRKTAANGRVRRAEALRLWLTCITFTGVKPHQRGPLRAGAGVPAGPEETEVTAHSLTRVGY